MPTVSLILPYFNRPKLMPIVINSILRNSIAPDEVIVIDDGSRYDCEKLVKKFKYKYIKLPKKSEYRNSSHAYNVGIKESKSDVCVLCPAELIHGPQNFEIIKRTINDDMLLIGSRVYFQGEFAYLLPWIKNEPEKIESQDNVRAYGEGNQDYHIIRHDDMQSGIHAVYKKRLLEVNGYDEELTSWGHNDSDMRRRLKELGLYEVKTNNIFSIHQWHKRPPQYNMKKSTEQRLKAESRIGFRCKKGIIDES